MPPKADIAGAKKRFPSVQMTDVEWVEAFDRDPDIMWRILGDVYDVFQAEEERAQGRHSVGRRPMRTNVSLIDFERVVYGGGYSMDPLPLALQKLMDGLRLSLRAFSARVPCDAGTLSRIMNGQKNADIQMLERFAVAGKVHPAYFLEWRSLYISSMVRYVLEQRPNLSVSPVRSMRSGDGAARERNGARSR